MRNQNVSLSRPSILGRSLFVIKEYNWPKKEFPKDQSEGVGGHFGSCGLEPEDLQSIFQETFEILGVFEGLQVWFDEVYRGVGQCFESV